MCRGETMRPCVLGLYKLLSWVDVYLGGHSDPLTSAVTGSSRTKSETEVTDWKKSEQVEAAGD